MNYVHLQWALSVGSTAYHYARIEFVMWMLWACIPLQACLVFLRISYADKNVISSNDLALSFTVLLAPFVIVSGSRTTLSLDNGRG